jgi:lysozyme
MKREAAIAGALAALCAAVAALTLALGFWAPWADKYVRGIDVSQHQGAIDWRAVAASGVRFAYIKASEGGDYRDPMFATNWRNAARAGLKRGAYHFFTLCRSGRAQAANFIAAVPRDPDALPPAVDLEHMGPCRHGPTTQDAAGEIAAYADEIEAHYGVRPILYTSAPFDAAHLKGVFAQERFWVRSLYQWPGYRRTQWIIWQRDHRAKVPGVSGPVDLNDFRGDDRAFDAFAGLSEKSS